MSLLKNFKSWYKGWDGELTVKLMQWMYLDKNTYHVFNNVILPKFGGGTTQIDHKIISVYGIFVIETKTMNGWISGSEKDTKWTQVFFSKKYSFQNPLRQNYQHIKTISEILKIPEEKFHSVIMFIGDCELKTNMPENVLLKGYTKYIKNKTNILLTENEVGSIIEGIKAYQLPSNFKSKTEHIQHVKSIKENKPYSTL